MWSGLLATLSYSRPITEFLQGVLVRISVLMFSVVKFFLVECQRYKMVSVGEGGFKMLLGLASA